MHTLGCFLLAVLFATSVYASNPVAAPDSALVLEGRITDSTNAVIPGARVELLAMDGKVLASTESDEAGGFRLMGLSPGTYDLRVQFGGFESRTERVTIAEGREMNASIALNAASVSETVTVTAEAAYSEPNAGSATKMEVPMRDVPQAIGVVNGELMRSQAANSMQDAVRNVPGVSVHLGEGRRDQVLIRGFSALNDQFVDGVRDDAPYYRDLSNVERIEVVKGPASVLYGRGSSGGVVNRVTKSPLPSGVLAELTTMAGSYGTKRVSIDLGAPIWGNKLTGRLTGAYEDSGSFRHYFNVGRNAVSPSLLWNPTGRTQAVFQSDNLYDSRLPDRGLPSVEGVPADIAPGSYYGAPAQDFLRNKAYGQTFRVEHKADRWVLRNTFRHTRYSNVFSNTQPTGLLASGGELRVKREQYNVDSGQTNYFDQAEAVTSANLLRMRHTVLIGTEYGRQTKDSVRFTGTAADVSLLNPVLTNPVYGTVPTTNNVFDGTIGAVYAQDLIEFGARWKALVGGRFDYYSQSLDDRNPANVDLKRTDRQVSPRAGIVYQPAHWVSVYTNFSRSFQPSGEGLSLAANAVDLKPEITSNYEVGSKFEVMGGRFSTTLSLFRLDRDNVKTTDPANPSKLLPIGLQRTDGFEISASGRLIGRVEVYGGYAWLDARTVKSSTVSSGVALAGKLAALVPKNSFNLWSTYSFKNGFGFGGGVIYNDDRYAEANDLVVLPSYVRVDATMFYRKRHYEIGVNLRNVGNVKYYESAHTNYQIMPGSPISGVLTTRFRW